MKIGKFDTQKKVFIIAELSANHNHSLQIAKDTIYAAKESGADAIKLQTYREQLQME
jgi:pseudaminic acid synthase